MKVDIQVQEGAVIVRIRSRTLRTGDGDVVLRRALRELLLTGARRVVLDLGRLRSVDGGALEELRRWGKVFRAAEASLHVVQPHLEDGSDLMRLDRSLHLYTDLEEALAAFRDEDRVQLHGNPRTLDEILAELSQAV